MIIGINSRGGNSKTITATTRQLESLIRISQALTKMRLESVVTAADVSYDGCVSVYIT